MTVIATTKSNKGKPFYLQFDFEAEIDRDMSVRMTCFLSIYFKLPARLYIL